MNNPNNQNTGSAGAPNERPPMSEGVDQVRRSLLILLLCGVVAPGLSYLYRQLSRPAGSNNSTGLSIKAAEKDNRPRYYYRFEDIPDDIREKIKKREFGKLDIETKIMLFQKYPGSFFDRNTCNVVTPYQQKYYLGMPEIGEKLEKIEAPKTKEKKLVGDSFRLMESAKKALLKANMALAEQGLVKMSLAKKDIVDIPLVSCFRSDGKQAKEYSERDEGEDNMAGPPGKGGHSIGQAIDVSGSIGKEQFKKVRKALLDAGWMDVAPHDLRHFEFKRHYSQKEREISEQNEKEIDSKWEHIKLCAKRRLKNAWKGVKRTYKTAKEILKEIF